MKRVILLMAAVAVGLGVLVYPQAVAWRVSLSEYQGRAVIAQLRPELASGGGQLQAASATPEQERPQLPSWAVLYVGGIALTGIAQIGIDKVIAARRAPAPETWPAPLPPHQPRGRHVHKRACKSEVVAYAS